MLTPGGDPFLHAPPRIQDGNCFSISSNMLDVEGDYRAPTGQPEFGSILDKANRTDTTNPALGIDYNDITIAPAPAPAATAAAPSYGQTSAPPILCPSHPLAILSSLLFLPKCVQGCPTCCGLFPHDPHSPLGAGHR